MHYIYYNVLTVQICFNERHYNLIVICLWIWNIRMQRRNVGRGGRASDFSVEWTGVQNHLLPL